MSERPVSEPGDEDRTVIRPMPGGTRRAQHPVLAPAPRRAEPAAAPDQPAPIQRAPIQRAPIQPAPLPRAPLPPPSDAAAPEMDTMFTGNNPGNAPLADAAAPLLHLLARLRNTATAPDPGNMRERTWRALRTFEQRALELHVPRDQLRLAHYALCASLDDAVLNTPWGNQGRWHDEPLARTLHQDDDAGRGFFEQLRLLRESLPGSLPVIELMFVCLSLGMMGPYRASPDGRTQIERARHHVYELIVQHGPVLQAALAPDAAGVDARFAPRQGGLPSWVAASMALALVAALYAWGTSSLNDASDAVYRAALASPPAAMPALVRPAATPPPPPPPPIISASADRLRTMLSGVTEVEVLIGPTATVVRIPAALLFPRLNATIGPGPLLDGVVKALAAEAGDIRVFGYTDSAPSRSAAFASNFALSSAQAKAVRGVLARTLANPARITAEGRADADPVATDSTPEARAQNYRIDIVLTDSP